MTHFSSTNFSHHLTSESIEGTQQWWGMNNGIENIFHIYQGPQHSLLESVESSLDEIYVNTRKKKRRTHWGKEGERVRKEVKKKQLFITINKQEGKQRERKKNCCLLIVTEVFFSLCVYRLNKIQMSESTREGPLFCIHNQSTFAFRFFFLSSSSYSQNPTPNFYYHLLC